MAPASALPQPTAKQPRNRGKYKTTTMEKKAAIIKQVKSGRSQAEVAREFGISKQTVSDYIKHHVKIEAAAGKVSTSQMKNFSQGSHPALEKALHMWLSATIAKRVPVSGDLLKQKAETLALRMDIHDFKFSDGWLRNFKKRYDLAFKKMCGESGAVDMTIVENYSDRLQSLLQQYSPDDIFNCDETGLFYKMMPDKTLAFSGEACHGGKHSKERVTVMVGSNMSGTEKLPILVIGKSNNPRCFKGTKSLPVWYEANRKAWITQQLFEDYVRRLDRKFHAQKRAVLLFVDNCAAHGHILNLQAIKLEFLPPNTTSVIQPMDQGVIHNLKVNYRRRLLSRTLLCLDNGKTYAVNLLSAMSMLSEAWKAVPQQTLRNCFRHAGFVVRNEESFKSCDPVPDIPDAEDILMELRNGGVGIPASVTFEKFVGMDSAVEPCAELTDDDIIREVSDGPNSESEPEEDSSQFAVVVPSNAELARAVALLSSVYSEDTTLRDIQADILAQRMKNARQLQIDNFFEPTNE
ncbi:tigger transposable element-derived protein 4-like [Ornithodoros turicata]|uniref:tigger transposable element-derived protein 4-like n=1 Tax=Ornithodoros turicata TaxID=34597 RepID=UPI003138F638